MQVYALLIWTVGYFPSSFLFCFCFLFLQFYGPLISDQHQHILTEQASSIKGKLIWPKPNVCLKEKASNPEWTRQAIMHAQAANRLSVGLHFARSQSQPHNKRTLKITWVLPWSNGKRKINTNLACKTLEGENTCIH